MTPSEWLHNKIEYWEQQQKAAAENGDYKAWEWAEREVNNYKQILKGYEAQ